MQKVAIALVVPESLLDDHPAMTRLITSRIEELIRAGYEAGTPVDLSTLRVWFLRTTFGLQLRVSACTKDEVPQATTGTE